jgi:hypothetical protein
MAFKPNYNQQRADRNRAKDQKKQEKLRLKEEAAAQRKAGSPEDGDAESDGGEDADATTEGETGQSQPGGAASGQTS